MTYGYDPDKVSLYLLLGIFVGGPAVIGGLCVGFKAGSLRKRKIIPQRSSLKIHPIQTTDGGQTTRPLHLTDTAGEMQITTIDMMSTTNMNMNLTAVNTQRDAESPLKIMTNARF